MEIKPAEIKIKTMPVTTDIRYSFVHQFLESSAIFVRQARQIEANFTSTTIDESTRCQHRGLVCATIMQCTAAMEAECYEICLHGPGCYLGNNDTNYEAREKLSLQTEKIDRKPVISRFNVILGQLKKSQLEEKSTLYKNAALVVELRRQIIHYKSHWSEEKKSKELELLNALITLKHNPPPFTNDTMKFFPHRALSADCAAWALNSAVTFLEVFYSALGVESRFTSYRERLIP